MRTIVPNLWVNDDVEAAVSHWLSAFEDGRVVSRAHYGEEAGDLAGQPMVVNFELHGQRFAAINGGGTRFTPSEAVSLAVPCDTQREVDRVWEVLTDGGTAGQCGWLEDRFGFHWQVYPARLDEMMSDPDPQRVQRVVACFMAVAGRPLSLPDLEAAYAGESAGG